jgi:dephospho-CoA kinase
MGRFLHVALTGGLAAGKSKVLRVFAECGACVLESDRLAREALEPGSAGYRAVVEAFGPQLLDTKGRIDRARLALRVFQDPQARERLEAIVHPEVRRRQQEWIRDAEAASDGGILVLDIPLLFEAGDPERFDVVVVVACSAEQQILRAVARGMTEDDARARIAVQMPTEEKVRRAHLVVDSSASQEKTRQRALEVFQELSRRQQALGTD